MGSGSSHSDLEGSGQSRASRSVKVEPGSITAADEKLVQMVSPLVLELGAYERHFNEMQSRYRSLASTWLLATFAALGFVLSNENFEIPFPRLLAAAGLALAGATGIILLWILDLMVYHRLLEATYVEGLRFERLYRWLPKVRTNMWKTQSGKGVLPRVVWFYLIGAAILISIAIGAFVIWLLQESIVGGLAALVGSLLVAVLLLWYMRRETCELSPFAPPKGTQEAFESRSASVGRSPLIRRFDGAHTGAATHDELSLR